MFLNVINPVGSLTSLDLGAVESWRLEMRAFPGNPVEAPTRKNMLGLLMSYGLGGQHVSLIIAAFDTDTEHEAEQVAAVGLPALTRDGNIDRVREAMKVIINIEGQTQASTTALIQQATRLVNLYHDLLAALFGKAATGLASIEVPLVGKFEDEQKMYRYALTTHRNQPWLAVEGTIDPGLGLGPPPGVAGAAPPVSKGGRHPATNRLKAGGKLKEMGPGPLAEQGSSEGREPETLGPPSAVAAGLPPLG